MRARVSIVAALLLVACKKDPVPDRRKLKITAGSGPSLVSFGSRDVSGAIDLVDTWTARVTVARAPKGTVIELAGKDATHDGDGETVLDVDLRERLSKSPLLGVGGGLMSVPLVVRIPGAEEKSGWVDVTSVLRAAVLGGATPSGVDDDPQRADSVLWVRKGDASITAGVVGRRGGLSEVDLVATVTEHDGEPESCGHYFAMPSYQLDVVDGKVRGGMTGGGTADVSVVAALAEVVVVDRRTGKEVARQSFQPTRQDIAAACPGSVREGKAVTVKATTDAQVEPWLAGLVSRCASCGAPAKVVDSAGAADGKRLPRGEGHAVGTLLRGDDGRLYLTATLVVAGGGTARLGSASWPIPAEHAMVIDLDSGALIGQLPLAPPVTEDGTEAAPSLDLPLRVVFAIERDGKPPGTLAIDAPIPRDAALRAIGAGVEGPVLFGAADAAAPAGGVTAALWLRDEMAPEVIGSPATLADLGLVVTVRKGKPKRSSAECAYQGQISASFPQRVKVVTERSTLTVTAYDRRTGKVAATTSLPPPKAPRCPESLPGMFLEPKVTVSVVADDEQVRAWIVAQLPTR